MLTSNSRPYGILLQILAPHPPQPLPSPTHNITSPFFDSRQPVALRSQCIVFSGDRLYLMAPAAEVDGALNTREYDLSSLKSHEALLECGTYFQQ